MFHSKNRRSRRRLTAGLAAAAIATLSLAACSSDPKPTNTSTGGGGGGGADAGVTITMWTRAATKIQSEAFVEAYNASHTNQVQLTVIPTDDYQPKIGAAAGDNSLPDLFASDIVFVPNYVDQGLFMDITDRIDALPFADQLAQSHIDTGIKDGKKHVLPHTMDLSVLFYNKDIYEQAGLDPEKPPTSLKEFGEHARQISAANIDGVDGTFFGGNCGGCLVFTWWPSLWASGGEPMNAEGTEANLDSQEMREILAFYKGLVDDGVVAAGTRDETGATWVAPFSEGKIGVMPMPSTMLGEAPANTGVTAIPGLTGGESTFVGGDGIGISRDSKNVEAAWEFLAWTMSEEAQVEVLAKNNDVVARTDLASNKYSEADPRVVRINEIAKSGRTPFSMKFGEAFNDPNGPWIVLFRNAVFGDGSTIEQDNDAVTAVLSR